MKPGKRAPTKLAEPPEAREDLTVSESVLAQLDELSWDELNGINEAVGILASFDGAITPALCRIDGAARAYTSRCFEYQGRPLGTRPRADVLADAVQQSLDDYPPTPEVTARRAREAAEREAKRIQAEAAAKAEEARRAAEAEAKRVASIPKTAFGRAFLVAVNDVIWTNTCGETLRYLATRCDEAGMVRNVLYEVDCKHVGDGVPAWIFRKNCEGTLPNQGWLEVVGERVFRLVVSTTVPWYQRKSGKPPADPAAPRSLVASVDAEPTKH
jgi:hypothetical protein